MDVGGGAGGLSAPARLGDTHDLSLFSSGEPSLDDWLRRRARANQAAGASRTFVVCRDGFVVAYYCLAAGAVAAAASPGRVRRNMPDPIPMAVLGRLAVDQSLQGQGIGRALLRDAVLRTLQAAEVLAVRGMLAQTLDANAQKFYLACGFVMSPSDPMWRGHALLLMATLADLAEAAGWPLMPPAVLRPARSARPAH